MASVGALISHSFKTEGKVLVKPGWLAIYGKEAADEVADAKDGDKGQSLVPVKPGDVFRADFDRLGPVTVRMAKELD